MDIAQLMTGSSAGVDSNSTGNKQSTESDFEAFRDYMNSFIETANEAKNITRKDSKAKVEVNASYESKITAFKNEKQDVNKIEADDEITENSEFGGDFPLIPLSPREKEAFERIAVLISDGGLDAESLEKLSEDEMAELVDWVLAGAGGIFEQFDESLVAATMQDDSVASDDVFGLTESAKALAQLDDLYGRISEEAAADADVALVGKLVGLEDLDAVEIDKIAQVILKLAESYSHTGEVNTDSDGQLSDSSLRDLLKNVPADELATSIANALADIDSDISIPQMPESVLKSLSIEIINVNNGMLDAADMRTTLLDGLTNNSQLRDQILNELNEQGKSEDLLQSVNSEEMDVAANPELLDELAQAVFDDSSEEELSELEIPEQAESIDSDAAEETPAEKTGGAEAETAASITVTPAATLAENTEADTVDKDVNLQQNNIKNQSQVNTSNVVPEVEEVIKTVVKEEVAEVAAREEGSTAVKDELTGKLFKGEDTARANVQDNAEFSGDNEDAADDETADSKKFQDGILTKDDFAIENEKSSSFNESFIDSDSKAEFKVFTPESNQSGYVTDNNVVRYSDMIENMEKIEKLMMSTSDKSLKSVTLEFSPPELGKLSIEVSVKNGNTSATLRVETDGARNMLLNNVEQLKKNLESHGLKLENFEVELNKQDQQDRNQQSAFAQAQQQEQERRSQQQSGRGRNGVAGVDQSEVDSEEVDTRQNNGIGSDGSVDIVA